MTKEKITILGVIPYIGSILIFLEISRLLIYYSFFDIDIINFVRIDELLVSFFDLLPLAVGLVLWNYFLNFYLYESNPNDPANTDSKIQGRINWSMNLLYAFIALWLGIAAYQSYMQYKILWLALLQISPFAGFLILKKFLRAHIDYISRPNGGMIITLFLIIVIMLNSTIKNAIDTKYFGKTAGVELLFTNGQKITSDSTIFYIGKTQDYVFIYNIDKKNCSAVKTEMVQELVYPSN